MFDTSAAVALLSCEVTCFPFITSSAPPAPGPPFRRLGRDNSPDRTAFRAPRDRGAWRFPRFLRADRPEGGRWRAPAGKRRRRGRGHIDGRYGGQAPSSPLRTRSGRG